MSDKVTGVIARSRLSPVEVVDVVVPTPTGHNVVVRIQACGVCHTDMAYREGGINDDFPFLLGHERLPGEPPRWQRRPHRRNR